MKKEFTLFYCILLMYISPSCKKLDFERVMDISTDSVNISGTSVIVHGTVIDLGNSTIVKYGHCWSTNPNPSIADYSSDKGSAQNTGNFSTLLTNITPGATHYVRSYIYDGNNYSYGDVLSFQITGDNILFSTSKAERIDISNTSVNSSTTGIGSIQFSNHGHCWSLTDPPSINDSITSLGPYKSDTVFKSTLHNLTKGKYYIRGYLEVNGYVIYSNTVSYEPVIEISTGLVLSVTDSSAVVNGNIKSFGVKPITKHGHCWSTFTSSPDLNNLSEHNNLGSTDQIGIYSSDLSNLIKGRVYYVRAYASDGQTAYYGEIRKFTAN
jgi:hypothetical protein